MQSLRMPAVIGLLALALAGSSGAARGPERAPKAKDVVPGEIVVVFRAGVSDAERGKALERAGLAETRKLTRDGRVRLAKGDPGRSGRALKELGSDPRVDYAEPNFVVRADATPSDPSFGQLWGLVNTGQTVDGAAGTPDADIDADAAWDVTTGNAGVVVGVVDTGVDFSHPELSGRSWVNVGEDCGGCRTNGVDDDGNGYVDDWRGWDFVNEDNDPFDDNGHGTHVAGTIGAAANNGAGIAGVAWEVRIAGLKFLDWFGSGTTADAIRAIDYATRAGIRITNNSWGGGGFSQALLDAIERAGDAGGLVVAAAGNDGVDNDATPHYPSSYESPAVLSVAASDSGDRLADFSNRGVVSVDLAAPGVSIYSSIPGGGYDWWSGTSMATPHVAGAAALVKAAFPSATGAVTKALLLRSVDAVGGLAATATGGRLNVGSAVGCSGAPKLWLEEPLASFEAVVGEPTRVVALAGACGDPAGATVTGTANGTSFSLANRGDGVWTGTFTPTATGAVSLSVSAAAGSATDTRTVSGSAVENYRILEEPHAWVDATAGGTNTGLRTDDGSVTVSLPFGFTLYGDTFTSVRITSNGYLLFGPGFDTYWANTDLPDAGEPNGIVAPFWDDLRLSSRGEVWYRTVGTSPNRRFVVSWIGAPHYYDVGDSTFQAILEEGTGDVVFQYQDVVFGDPAYDYGASATIGLESLDGARARVFSFDEPSLTAYERAKAVRFTLAGTVADPDTTPPAAPTGLTATGGEAKVLLDWADNAEADLAGYRVYRDGAAVATTGTSEYADAAVTAGTAYAYRVAAVDTSGNESAPSSEATATPTADTTPPAVPTGLTAAAGDSEVALDWADNGESDLAGYRVYRDGVRVASPAASAHTDTGLANGTTYRYRVSAVDASGNESALSAEISATPQRDPVYESFAPSSFAVVAGSHSGGSLSSLAADDGDRLVVSASGTVELRAAVTLPSTSVSALDVEYDGHASKRQVQLTYSLYNWRTGAWDVLASERAPTSDVTSWWSPAAPGDYVSAGGEIRFSVRGQLDRRFHVRSDLVAFWVEH